MCLSAASTQTGTAGAASAQADSVKADLLTAVPGAPGQGVQLNLGDVTTSAGTPAATSPASTPTTAPPIPAVASGTSPTAVHTGEWWAGSTPVAAAIAGLGLLLIGWPRIRRLRPLARFGTRARH